MGSETLPGTIGGSICPDRRVHTALSSPPSNRHLWRALAIAVVLLLALTRAADLRTFPMLAVDEGIWSMQSRDAAVFGDIDMNGQEQVALSPLHISLLYGWFKVFPGTCWSVRYLSAALGGVALWILWLLVRQEFTRQTAWKAMALVGLSFTMMTMNRRAYLESGVMLLSTLAVLLAARRGTCRYAGLAPAEGVLLASKAAAAYMLLCLLLPSGEDSRWGRDIARRGMAVGAGIVLAGLAFLVVRFMDPAGFRDAFQFELVNAEGKPLIAIGRFGLYPSVVFTSLVNIVRGYTDLVLLSVLAVVGFAATRAWHSRLAVRLLLWLVCGFAALLMQGFQHNQYFAPLVIPAGVLTVVAADYARQRGMPHLPWILNGAMVLVVLFSLARFGSAWVNATVSNPPLEAVQWYLSRPVDGTCLLATPEIAAAIPARTYAFNRIFRPLGSRPVPNLEAFVKDHNIGTIIFDQWESGTYRYSDEFTTTLNQYKREATGKGWVAYSTRGPGMR